MSPSVGGSESNPERPASDAALTVDEGEPEESDLLARAVRLDADHRAEAGRPISADRLRHELGVGSDLARRLVRELREHAGPNGHAGDEAGQLQLAGGGRHEHCVPYVDPDQAGRLARDTAHLLRDLDGHGPSPRLEVVQ